MLKKEENEDLEIGNKEVENCEDLEVIKYSLEIGNETFKRPLQGIIIIIIYVE